MHLMQPGYTYRVRGPFPKQKEIIQKFKETEYPKYDYRSDLDNTCFQYDIAYNA